MDAVIVALIIVTASGETRSFIINYTAHNSPIHSAVVMTMISQGHNIFGKSFQHSTITQATDVVTTQRDTSRETLL